MFLIVYAHSLLVMCSVPRNTVVDHKVDTVFIYVGDFKHSIKIYRVLNIHICRGVVCFEPEVGVLELHVSQEGPRYLAS